MLWVIVFAALIYALPFLRENLRPRMGAKARKSAPGQFARLSQGTTHYQWHGPEHGPVFVCVHGLTTPPFVFGPIVKGLVAKGYRVLTYDHYGRGFSDRPEGLQDSTFFVTHLQDLLVDQNVNGKFNLLGYSMGGGVVTAYAARHPGRIDNLILLAPIGMGHDLGPIGRLAADYDWIGRWLMLAFYPRNLRRGCEAERGLPSDIENVVDLQKNELRYRGFVPAVRDSLRGIIDENFEAAHRSIQKAALPVMAIWGERDDVIPVAGKEQLSEWNPSATQHVIKDADHTLAYTATQEVLKALPEPL